MLQSESMIPMMQKMSGNREGNASPTSLTFTPANFATPQIVTVSSNDDLEVDGMKTYTIRTQNTASSTDTDYNGT
jgi:hypothetical protein